MSSVESRVHLSDLLRGTAELLPDLFTVQRAALGLVLTSPDSRLSIGAVLEKQARERPQATALLFEDRRWTYGQFNAWANRHAAAFRAAGVRCGDKVAILMENRPEVLAAVAGAVKLGAVAGMLNYYLRGDFFYDRSMMFI